MYGGRSEYVLLFVLCFQEGKPEFPSLCPPQNQFLGWVTCRVGSVTPKATRAAQGCNVNIFVTEKQKLELKQHLSVSGLCPVVQFTIISFEHMVSLNQELVNCWDAKLVTLLYRCDSMCCRGFFRSVAKIQILQPK